MDAVQVGCVADLCLEFMRHVTSVAFLTSLMTLTAPNAHATHPKATLVMLV